MSTPTPKRAPAKLPKAKSMAEDTELIECLDAHRAFCIFKLDSGFISIGLPNGVSGAGLTLREALDDVIDNQTAYECELQAKKEP